MKYLTTKEKITFLNDYPIEKIDELTYIVKDGVIDEQEKRIRVRKDFRAEVKAKIAEAGITRTQLAKRLGVKVQNLSNFLNGRILLRYELIEELMWLIEDNNILIEDENERLKNSFRGLTIAQIGLYKVRFFLLSVILKERDCSKKTVKKFYL